MILRRKSDGMRFAETHYGLRTTITEAVIPGILGAIIASLDSRVSRPDYFYNSVRRWMMERLRGNAEERHGSTRENEVSGKIVPSWKAEGFRGQARTFAFRFLRRFLSTRSTFVRYHTRTRIVPTIGSRIRLPLLSRERGYELELPASRGDRIAG